MPFVRTFNSHSCSVFCTAVMLMTSMHSCTAYNVLLYEKKHSYSFLAENTSCFAVSIMVILFCSRIKQANFLSI